MTSRDRQGAGLLARRPSTLIFIASLGLISAAASAADREAGGPAWELIAEEDGIRALRLEVPGSPIVRFRGEAVVKATLDRAVSVLLDSSRGAEWIDSIKSTRLVRRPAEDQRIVHTKVRMPLFLSDRDFVTLSKFTVDEQARRFVLRQVATQDPEAPGDEDHVRGDLTGTNYLLTSVEGGAKTHVVAEIHADPRGWLPKWIVNLFQKSWPRKTLSNLRRQVAKPDIKDIEGYEALFAQLRRIIQVPPAEGRGQEPGGTAPGGRAADSPASR